MFRKFARLEQRDIQAILDYSKDAWNGSKSAMFYMPDGTSEFFSIDGTDYSETNYGIFASNSASDIEKKMKVEQLAQAMIQNGTPASIVAEAIDQESFTAIKDKIRAAEKAQQELQQAQQQAQMEMQEKQIQAANQQKAMEMENSDKNRQTQIEVALINAEANQELKRQELELKAQELKDKADNMDDKIRLEEKRINSQERVAKDSKRNASK
jgi:hypothetical protein